MACRRMLTQTLLFLSRQHSHGKIHITYLCTPAPNLVTRSTSSDGRRVGNEEGMKESVGTKAKIKKRKEQKKPGLCRTEGD